MAEAEKTQSEKVYTLTQVSKLTDISMPTLQRYKKLYQDRIPSRGAGRSQRYLEGALDVFRALKEENIGRRGRPRKTGAPASPRAAAKPAAKKAAAPAAAKPASKPAAAKQAPAAGGLLTLTQVGKLTGVSYPTLLRYVRLHLKEIPHKGSGRNRRFLPESVEVFKRLREESPRGRQPKEKKAAAPKAAPKAKAAPKTAAKPAAKPPAKAAAKAAAPVVKKKVGRPPKAAAAPPAAVPAAGDATLAARVKELEKTQKSLEKLVAQLQKELGKPIKLVLQRK